MVSVPAAVGGVFEVMVTIIAALAVPFLMVLLALIYRIGLWTRPQKEQLPEHLEPFVISKYYARTEQAALDILETQEPVDQTIILWWGLDGLRLNEDGELEWISRKTPKPVNQNVSYHPCQSIQTYNPNLFDQTQSTRASIDALMDQNVSLQMQAYQAQQTAQLINSMQQCCVQYPAQYPPYFYGGCCGNYVG